MILSGTKIHVPWILPRPGPDGNRWIPATALCLAVVLAAAFLGMLNGMGRDRSAVLVLEQAILFLLREGLVEMDVPTRQSYVMAVVRPEERTVVSGGITWSA